MAQKVKIALLPCPCCGGSAEYTETSLPDAYSDHEIIACTECHLQMDNASPQEWNRRVQNATQVKLAVGLLRPKGSSMSEEHEKQFASWFAKFITQTQKLDYESICKKAFMAGVEAAQQSAHQTNR